MSNNEYEQNLFWSSKPGTNLAEQHLRILHISDTHGFHHTFPVERFENIDVVVHSGDCSNYRDPARNESEVLHFLDWYADVPVKHKIYVAGNHDTSIEKGLITPSYFESRGIVYLQDSDVRIEGVKFYGSPWTPEFGQWSFMKRRDRISLIWDNIPSDTDVLITHGPPKGYRDLSFDRDDNLEMCGCSALAKKCDQLKNTLQLVCYGHIHNMSGIKNQGVSSYSHTCTVFSNAACVTDRKFEGGLSSTGNVLLVKKTKT